MNLLLPDWPAPPGVRACVSTRADGVSGGCYASLNLGDHVGDAPEAVAENRRLLGAAANLPAEPAWLKQVHGVAVVQQQAQSAAGAMADACWTAEAHVPCAVLTADCLPVLFASRDGRVVAAAHAGWRGLCDGVLEATLTALPAQPGELLAWLGPAIGPAAFEVGAEVRAAFIARAAEDASAFEAVSEGKYLADLFALARARLRRAGVMAVYGGGICTVSDPVRFFSHRRDAGRLGSSGRFASLVWRES